MAQSHDLVRIQSEDPRGLTERFTVSPALLQPVGLLQQFAGYLPIAKALHNGAWEVAAKRLDGAVGDVIRKVCDHLIETRNREVSVAALR